MPKAPALTPDAMTVRAALNGSAPLVRLGQLMADSKARFDVICPSVPAALLAHLKAGPLDDEGWSLLAANPSVAAKVRQLQPRLQQALLDAGWGAAPIRIKVPGR